MEGRVYVATGRPCAYETTTGKLLWENKEVRAGDGSPTWWAPPGASPVLLINGSKEVAGLDPATGAVRWTVPGGSQSTPVAAGDYFVIYSSTEGVGLRVYQYQPQGEPKALWSHYWLTRRYTGTPIVHNGTIYAMCGEKHLCFDLISGKKHWEETVNSTISSPLLVDGKIFIQENNGTHIRMVKADPSSYQMLARGKAAAMSCATPALAAGQMIVRQKDKLVAFDVRAPLP
jgi:outer membrane protein assembly factor BamB